MYDIIIQGGLIVDGSGAPSYRGDIAIKNGRIDSIGLLGREEAKRVINATGLIITPGFIDIHSHDDLYVLEDRTVEAKIRQGVTSTVIGNCGFGLFPVLPENKNLYQEYVAGLFGEPENKGNFGFNDLSDFFSELMKKGTTINVASLVAHGVLRISVMGYENRRPTEVEMQKMKDLLRHNLKSGAVGMSMGLIYAPGAYAHTDELIELSKVVSEEGGIIAVHMRGESNFLLESIEEVLTIAREAKVPLEISHLKAVGNPNFGKGREAISLISKARREGIDVTFDQYPYLSGSTTATTLLPPWALEGGVEEMLGRIRKKEIRYAIIKDMNDGIDGSGWVSMSKLIGWENIMICSLEKPENKKYEGSNVKDIATELNRHPSDVMLDLLDIEDGRVIIILFQQDENDLKEIMVNDLQMFGSDGLPIKNKKTHPRLYGTYPRILGTYVREHKLMTLERAIFKMTYMPANRLGLLNYGLLRPGMVADITMINFNNIEDLSTYTHPNISPKGIEVVIVNGVIVMEKGSFTGEFPGKPLRRFE